MFTNLQKINNFNDRCAPRVSTVHFLIFLVETTFKRTKPRTQYVGEKLMSNGVNPVLFYSYLNSIRFTKNVFFQRAYRDSPKKGKLKDDILIPSLKKCLLVGLEQKVGHCHTSGQSVDPRKENFDPFIPCTGQHIQKHFYCSAES